MVSTLVSIPGNRHTPGEVVCIAPPHQFRIAPVPALPGIPAAIRISFRIHRPEPEGHPGGVPDEPGPRAHQTLRDAIPIALGRGTLQMAEHGPESLFDFTIAGAKPVAFVRVRYARFIRSGTGGDRPGFR